MLVDYFPPGKVAAAFLNSEAFVAGLRGPVGSGKSVCCAMKILDIASRQPLSPVDGMRHSRMAVVRNTYPELKTTTIKTWLAWVPENIGTWRDEGPPTHNIKTGDLDIEVMFLALDRPADIRKMLSLELTAAWINEAREIPKAVLDGLTARVGRYPDAKHGGCLFPQIIMDTNSPDTDHWWYWLAEEDTPEGWAFFSQPGGMSNQVENVEGLSRMLGGHEGYYRRASQGKSREWIDVYINGNYGFVIDGKPVYPEFNDAIHIGPVEFNDRLPVFVGIDFGLTPAATLMHKTVTGRYLVFDELVTFDMGAVRFGELLRDKLTQYGINDAVITGDPAGDARSQTDEKTPFEILKSIGLDAKPAQTNDFIRRRESVVRPLMRLIDGLPGMLIDPRCKNLRKAMMGGYCYRRVQVSGSERFMDKADKGPLSHVAEAHQYNILGAGEYQELIRRPRDLNRRPVLYAITD